MGIERSKIVYMKNVRDLLIREVAEGERPLYVIERPGGL